MSALARAVASVELTEESLTEALCEARTAGAPVQLVLSVGRRAKLRADRIVRSPGGPLYEVVPVVENPLQHPDHWILLGIPKRKTNRRRAA